MTSESGSSTVRRSWTLLLGPGPTLGECLPFLEALARTRPASAPTGLEQLENWNALFCDLPEVGRILVDADSFELETLGLLRAFLERSPGWELALMGTDGGQHALRKLLRRRRTRWIPSPLDLDSMSFILEVPRETARETTSDSAPQPAAPAPKLTPRRPAPGPPALDLDSSQDGFLEEVERILRGEASAAASPSAAPVAPSPETVPELAVSVATEPELSVELPDLEPQPTRQQSLDSPPPPAPYFKHQVADLADLVQCVDLGLDQAVEDVAELEGPAADRLAAQFEQLSGEVARLRQFTHTLSFLASPPAGGQQSIDLAPLLEEMLTMRRAEAEAPRYLLRTPEPLPIRSDKILLSQAFDALLFLCQVCAEEEGTVRVDGRVLSGEAGADNGIVQISIRFPAGRFEELQPAEILEPYALRRELPELGANSLAAATGILRGQGGSVELHKEPGGGLEWLVRLPRA